MSSSPALCCLPSVKQKQHFHCLLLLSLNDLVFCDIQNNQGFGKGYQPHPTASADNPYLDLDYSGYLKNHIQ